MESNNLTQMTFNEKKAIFDQLFSSGNNTTAKFSHKIELLNILCCLTQQLRKKDPVKYKSTADVLEVITHESVKQPTSSIGNYLSGLAIVCDDLLFGVTEQIKISDNLKTGAEAAARTKELIAQWLPF